MGVKYAIVEADTGGAIGGNYSHEFHVLAKNGEGRIFYCENVGTQLVMKKLFLMRNLLQALMNQKNS